MSHFPLLPKNRVGRIVVLDICVFVVVTAPYICWTLIRHERLHWDSIATWALIIALSSWLSNIDYYGWRSNLRQPDKISPDREEALPAREAIDNRS
jgi:hypothetical protein